MQQQRVGQYQELNQTEEGDKALNKLKEMKKRVEEANSMEESLESQSEKEKVKDLEMQLAEKDASLDKLKKMITNFKASEAETMALLSDCIKRIQELESELDKRKKSEGSLYDSLVMQTKQLEHNKVLLEESKLEIASLQEKVETLQGSAPTDNHIPRESKNDLQVSENSVPLAKPKQAAANEKLTPAKAKIMLEEMSLLRNELKLAIDAEENSKKAMDDLALALKEVATEANQAKEKLIVSNLELENFRGEANQLRVRLKSTEDKYKALLEEVRKEADQSKNTTERLRLEAEESLLAWNGKETEFVNCIRRAEEERSAAQEEVTRLLEEVRLAENRTNVSKEENQKLRDILKQALNEANVAKEAAGIARAENSQLQDTLAGKEEALNLLAQENEMLKIHEAAAFENIKELQRLLSESSVKELKNEDKEKSSAKELNKEDKEGGKKAKEQKHGKNLSKTFSFNLKEMIIPHKQHKEEEAGANNKADDALKGSIFDEDVCTPDSAFHHNGEMFGNSLDFDHLDDEMGNSRKRRALLRRFGDLIRRGYHRKEQSFSLE